MIVTKEGDPTRNLTQDQKREESFLAKEIYPNIGILSVAELVAKIEKEFGPLAPDCEYPNPPSV